MRDERRQPREALKQAAQAWLARAGARQPLREKADWLYIARL
jgi:hypothetical protein